MFVRSTHLLSCFRRLSPLTQQLPKPPQPPLQRQPSSSEPTSVVIQSLNYAVDAEFLKCDGRIYARSVAFVPFATSSTVPLCKREYAKCEASSSPVSSSMLMGAPRKLGAAAEALRRARERKSSPQTLSPSATNSSSSSTTSSPLSKLLPSDIFRPIVLAIRASNVTCLADVLPCGHIVERHCAATTTPTAAGFGTATWEPHPLYQKAVAEGRIYPTPFSQWDLEPYTIPNVKRHEGLLRRAYASAVESVQSADVSTATLDAELMLVFGKLSWNKSKYGRENLLRSLLILASRRDALLSRFSSEDAFIDFLHRCAAKVERALQNAEARYFNSNLLGREVNRGQQAISAVARKDGVMGSVVLVDTLEELSLATSFVWKCLTQSREEVSRQMMSEVGVDKDLMGALLHDGVKRSGFYNYGGADTEVLQQTVGMVLRSRTDESATVLQLSTFLDSHPELTEFRGRLMKTNNNDRSEKDSGNPTQPLSPSVLLVTSKYDISMRDITSHTRFQSSGLVQRKGKVPKLVDALGMLEPRHDCAIELHKTAAVDVHNPLWDAAALAAVCTFVLND